MLCEYLMKNSFVQFILRDKRVNKAVDPEGGKDTVTLANTRLGL